ncbi:ATP-binding protein [Chitinilyticum aquatile]|uniref:ATP-binding protein n=1 Tax=Chitinilyticum aquatile TaxID=362520 RepID=UPI0004282C14|nr:ATP-binding protein [Chitinilyticum aquatile]
MSCIDRIAQLKSLQLYGMAATWGELHAEKPRQPPAPEAWLARLIEAEQQDRQTRSLRYQLKAAKFPIHRDLAAFDWAAPSPTQAEAT